jgi:hypothetical protein
VTPPGIRITTADVPSDPRLALSPGEVAIESIAHACFRIHAAAGSRILIDPYASRVGLGYDFPDERATDAILMTHPHFDHDGGEFGRTVPWTPDVPVLGSAESTPIRGARNSARRTRYGSSRSPAYGSRTWATTAR